MSNEIEITYSGKYTPFSRKDLIKEVKKAMKPSRFQHVLRVEQTALQLAEQYDVDQEKVSIAALTHDIAKDQSDEEMRDVIISENLDLELLDFGSSIWHGPIGELMVRKKFDIKDKDILRAIRHHTIGAVKMGMVEQMIYLSDYIEPNRSFPGVTEARSLAKSDLNEAISFAMVHTIQHLLDNRKKVYPIAIETYNAWVVKD